MSFLKRQTLLTLLISSNKQGGVLSPLLFNVYVNELSELLNKSSTGGNMGGTIINYMLCADDIISLFSSGLQHTTIKYYCELHNLMFNTNKSMCMYLSIKFILWTPSNIPGQLGMSII